MNAESLFELLKAVKEPDICLTLGELDMLGAPSKKLGRFSVALYCYQAPEGYFPKVVDALTATASDAGVRLEVNCIEMSDRQHEALEAYLLNKNKGLDGETPTNTLLVPGSKVRVLGFSSGKGGVGKSSVTLGVASALTRLGHKVGILDADVYGFSIPKMLGIRRTPSVVGKILIPPVAYGIRTMSVGYFVSDETPVIWRGPMLHKALEQFLVDVYWGDIDFLCVDMPPGTGDVTLSLAEYMPKIETFVVTTPQDAAERVAQRSALAARKLKLPLRGVIENMTYFRGDDGKRYEIFGSGGGEDLSKTLDVPLIGSLPIDISLRHGGDIGEPIVFSAPDSDISAEFTKIAQSIEKMGPARIYKSELKIR